MFCHVPSPQGANETSDGFTLALPLRDAPTDLLPAQVSVLCHVSGAQFTNEAANGLSFTLPLLDPAMDLFPAQVGVF
jgi:hypothetical protein